MNTVFRSFVKEEGGTKEEKHDIRIVYRGKCRDHHDITINNIIAIYVNCLLITIRYSEGRKLYTLLSIAYATLSHEKGNVIFKELYGANITESRGQIKK